MKDAIHLSQQALEENLFPVAAIVLSPEGEVVGKSTNTIMDPNSPLRGTPFGHAEMAAMLQACKDLKKRFLKEYKIITTCEPCPMCLGAMYCAGIREYIYAASIHDTAQLKGWSFPDLEYFSDIQKDPDERDLKGWQIMRHEATSVLNRWGDMIVSGEFHFPWRNSRSKST